MCIAFSGDSVAPRLTECLHFFAALMYIRTHCAHLCMCVCVHACVRARARARVCVCAVCVYTRVCVYVCSYVQEFAVDGLVNLVGGCCGSTPEHIRCVEGREGRGGEGRGEERRGEEREEKGGEKRGREERRGEEGAFVQCFSQLPVVVRYLLT